MAQFDVHVFEDSFALDCQSNLLRHLNTRLIVPVRPLGKASPVKSRLNPVFEIDGEAVVMMTEFASTVFVRELKRKIISLVNERDRIVGALDMLITGF